ncbi:BolA family transcriptional regulator [Halobacteriovorax marinus]|uniref:BolA-like protein n=1 Tax=Halobacteriovorax marinus (strain ATCC BAA-682 / DSM 15412 / SJ) TaxID=862908 RepID=E1X4B5_HALMS|nr:BolA family protein [Halobacteriovorax marinus]ATH08398.1 BolA family transcriptional regulator [Halobacteriovorax marinus]CBW27087.1 BolA-like protein [Halobacteriovorax marinus SJ]
MNFEELKALIQSHIEDAKVQVTDLTGTQDHLGLLVVSDVFKGKMLIAQHQIIMDILKEKLKQEIHAVQIKTMTHEQATNQGIQI